MLALLLSRFRCGGRCSCDYVRFGLDLKIGVRHGRTQVLRSHVVSLSSRVRLRSSPVKPHLVVSISFLRYPICIYPALAVAACCIPRFFLFVVCEMHCFRSPAFLEPWPPQDRKPENF
ncbi:unnamed protein product [Amoebophrya sp. A25]|nr:unnamed protein product [Amoebophrya sp. A25]|eukprot:GSA25T00001151001.1